MIITIIMIIIYSLSAFRVVVVTTLHVVIVVRGDSQDKIVQ